MRLFTSLAIIFALAFSAAPATAGDRVEASAFAGGFASRDLGFEEGFHPTVELQIIVNTTDRFDLCSTIGWADAPKVETADGTSVHGILEGRFWRKNQKLGFTAGVQFGRQETSRWAKDSFRPLAGIVLSSFSTWRNFSYCTAS